MVAIGLTPAAAALVNCAAPRPPIHLRPVTTATSRRTPKKRPHGHSGANGERSERADRSDNISRVYHDLRALIVWGQLPPGARIAERAVADRLGMSRTPVRSALHRLQQEGFIASADRAGDQRLIVTPLTQDDGRELFLIVGHLEGLAAHTAASLPKERRKKIVQRLRELNRDLAAESRRRDAVTRIFDLDMEFHRTYVENVAGQRLVALHRAIKPQTERYVRLYVSVLLDELPTSVREHDLIIRAIAKGAPEAAQHAVERNWHNAADRLARIIAQHGERGIWHAWQADAPSNTT
jgi:DNA-binding GntR family transcriptional regulator